MRGPKDVNMTFLFEIWGLPSDETALKHDLSEIANPIVTDKGKKRSEWFETTDEARDWLRHVRSLYFVATKPEEIEELPFCDSKEWLPRFTTNRRPKIAQDTLFETEEGPWADLTVSEVMEGDFYTSPELVPSITAALGGEITLDPASCKEANSIVRARNFYGSKEDGLQQNWTASSVYVNAPFGQWKLWATKIVHEWESGNIGQMIVMAPSRATTSREFHPLIQACNAIFWPRGRYAFKGPLASSPDEGHFLFYFGSEVERFCQAFAHFGTCFATGKTAA